MKKTLLTALLIALISCTSTTPPAQETTERYSNETETVFCTADVRECADGSFVSRQGPACAFAACPDGEMKEETAAALNETRETPTSAVATSEEKMTNTLIEMQTSKGTMKIKLYDDKAPKTVENFKTLVSKGFYDGIIFHRVIKNFMIQGGDPTGTGMGGPGYTIKDEFAPGLKHDRKGLLSMANAGPNTGGSQFFITLVPTPWLDGRHAIFGEVIEGLDVLEAIGSTPTDASDRPKTEVKMVKVSIIQ